MSQDRRTGRSENFECGSSSGQVFLPPPSLQLTSLSDESLVLLYLSLSDEVELMAAFTPVDVISVQQGAGGWDTCWDLLLSTSTSTCMNTCTCTSGLNRFMNSFGSQLMLSLTFKGSANNGQSKWKIKMEKSGFTNTY